MILSVLCLAWDYRESILHKESCFIWYGISMWTLYNTRLGNLPSPSSKLHRCIKILFICSFPATSTFEQMQTKRKNYGKHYTILSPALLNVNIAQEGERVLFPLLFLWRYLIVLLCSLSFYDSWLGLPSRHTHQQTYTINLYTNAISCS